MKDKSKDIQICREGQLDILKTQEFFFDWIEEYYSELIEKISMEKIPSILFILLDDIEFESVFGKRKEELEHLII
ncbi:MAG: hypothetical protein AB2421_01360 [Thermotaleaceae bacterium]